MQAGKLRHIIDIEKVTETKSASGAVVETWTSFLTNVRASAEPVTGRESYAASQTYSEYEIKFIMRYREGITAKMRVVYKGDYYDIDTPINLFGRNKTLVLFGTRYND